VEYQQLDLLSRRVSLHEVCRIIPPIPFSFITTLSGHRHIQLIHELDMPALLTIKALDKLNRKDIAVFTMELE